MASDSISRIAEIYAQLNHGTVLTTPGPRDTIRIEGKDRATFLHSFCTNDIQSLSLGEMCEAFFCNVQGKTLGHGYVLCQENDLILDLPAGEAPRLTAHLDRYLIREDVTLHDESSAWQHVVVAGDRADAWMQQFAGTLPEMGRHVPISVAGFDGLAIARDWLSVRACTLMLRCHSQQELWRSLGEITAVDTSSVLFPATELFEILRIEHATPLFGRDISDENLPQEADRDAVAISFRKGCYLGQETVARLDALGHVNRKLCRLSFDTAELPPHGAVLKHGEKQVGTVTSAALSPRYGMIGLGYVRRECFTPGTVLSSALGGVRVEQQFGTI